jgi:hypothetical protein
MHNQTSEARRAAKANGSEEVDSGWEDNNIFQSGAESSPVRPSPSKPRARRSSAAPRKTSRQSMSVPPQFSPPSPPKEDAPKPRSARKSSVKPPESTFEPILPPEAVREHVTPSPRKRAALIPEVVVSRLTSRDVVDLPSDTVEASRVAVLEDTVSLNEVEAEAVTSSVVSKSEQEPSADMVIADHGEEEGRMFATLSDIPEASQEDASQEIPKIYEGDSQTSAVAQRIAEGGKVVRRKVQKSPAMSNTMRFLLALIGMAGLTSLYNYKSESSTIGFCETGMKSNEVLEALRTRRAAVVQCNHENRTLLWTDLEADKTRIVNEPTPALSPGDSHESQLVKSELCPPLPLLPIPPPDECTPCPDNAVCTSKSMTCETGYLLRPHFLLSFLSLPGLPSPKDTAERNTYIIPEYETNYSSSQKSVSYMAHSAVSLALDGFPGLGPVALAPRCVEDPRRKHHIGALGRAVEHMLASERGRRLCAGVGSKQEAGTQAEEAKKWGVDVETLKEALKTKTSVC